jgi:hypothetical protein
MIEESVEEAEEEPSEIERLKKQLQEQMAELNALRAWRDTVIQSAPAATQNEIVKPTVKKKVPVKASKKEQEKGMWCTTCEECKTVAQFTSDLRDCGNCKKLCHYNDDLHSCYHWDCSICKKAICLKCNRAAGGNKMHPLCSDVCAKKYKESRA